MIDTINFEIRPQDGYGRIRIETKHPIYSKYNRTASSFMHVYREMNLIADQMNNGEGMGCTFTVEGM